MHLVVQESDELFVGAGERRRAQPQLDLGARLGKNARCRMPEKSSIRNRSLTRKETRELEVKISFLEGLVQRDPNYVEALQILGDHYSERGNHPQSLQVDERLSRLKPVDPLVFYNLACSYSLCGEFARAAGALEKALALGYRDFTWLAKDPDLRPLRLHPLYRSIETKIRQIRIKIA
jgi:tetratricopeptide (TPR) repeat protein